MQPTITHIALHVRDLDACVAFYERFCNMRVVHERPSQDLGGRVVWMSEPGRERRFIFVLLPGGPGHETAEQDFSHLGFAVGSRAEVDDMAEAGRQAGCLALPPRQDDYPVGYYCVLRDPDGHLVEFSYGQPLGPGAESGDADTLV